MEEILKGDITQL